jgi:Protein of unknown function (DUF3224)
MEVAMRSRLALLALCGSISVALALMPNAALAQGPPIAATGAFTLPSFIPSNTRVEGAVTLFDFTGSEDLTGTFSGTALFAGSCVVRPAGIASCLATEHFTGTVAGHAGTVNWHAPAQIDLATGSVSGRFIVFDGTGDLAGLQGQGTFVGSLASGTYSGRFVFAP